MIVVRSDAGQLGLAHLLAADQQPAVREHLAAAAASPPPSALLARYTAWKRRMSLPTRCTSAGQVSLEPFGFPCSWFGAVADRGDVVQERVEPDVGDLLGHPSGSGTPQ